MTDVADRRPVAARETAWARKAAQGLAGLGVSPNQVSIFGLVATVLTAACLVLSRDADGAVRVGLLLGAAATIPIRALCNMLDGMVAVEFGRQTKSGVVFNELPDRFSDAIMLVGAGYAVPNIAGADALGWAAALLAVVTAYLRALGGSTGVSQDFSGPMAKQQRMAVMCLACLASTFEGLWDHRGYALFGALILVAVGCLVTIARRTRRLIRRLETQ